jgi:telomerase reverse transcriptase
MATTTKLAVGYAVCFCQRLLTLLGFPLSEVQFTRDEAAATCARKLSDISLVRSRIFYAKPALTAKGLVQAGFKHIRELPGARKLSVTCADVEDVLNRCPRIKSPQAGSDDASPRKAVHEDADAVRSQSVVGTLKIAMYMFPRQFRLHNVFTSHVDRKLTAQKFQDYTLREAEVGPLLKGEHLPKIPKRLRGNALHLVERLQILHERCSYVALLRHYCPSVLDPVRHTKALTTKDIALQQTQTRKRSKKCARSTQPAVAQLDYKAITDLATPTAHVSAFCQAVLSKVVPDGFWGTGETLNHNKRMLLRKVDHFVKLRRFEAMSLHEIVQCFRVRSYICRKPIKFNVDRLWILRGYTSATSAGRRPARRTSTNETRYFTSFFIMSLILCSFRSYEATFT